MRNRGSGFAFQARELATEELIDDDVVSESVETGFASPARNVLKRCRKNFPDWEIGTSGKRELPDPLAPRIEEYDAFTLPI